MLYYMYNIASEGEIMDEYLLPEEFAREASVHPETVRRWLREGIINGKKFGRKWRIPKSELDKVLPENK